MIPGSDDDGSDRSQGGRNPSWIGLPQALHRKMPVFCARQKRKEKKVQWQWMNSPFLGEEKSQVCIFPLATSFLYTRQRKSLQKLGETKISKV